MSEANERDWLARLSVADWLASATNEIAHAKEALLRKAYRTGVTHARRGAGMALNALLCLRFRPDWGRSYMDHIVALAQDNDAPEAIRHAAQTLVDTKPQTPELIALGKPDLRVFEASNQIANWVKTVVQTLRAAHSTN